MPKLSFKSPPKVSSIDFKYTEPAVETIDSPHGHNDNNWNTLSV
jgi:hypothetical protein